MDEGRALRGAAGLVVAWSPPHPLGSCAGWPGSLFCGTFGWMVEKERVFGGGTVITTWDKQERDGLAYLCRFHRWWAQDGGGGWVDKSVRGVLWSSSWTLLTITTNKGLCRGKMAPLALGSRCGVWIKTCLFLFGLSKITDRMEKLFLVRTAGCLNYRFLTDRREVVQAVADSVLTSVPPAKKRAH